MPRKLGTPPSLPKQNKSSTVRSTHSWASDTTCSTVLSLCFLCFTLSLTEEEDVERTSESKTRACTTRMLVLSSWCVWACVSLLLCGQKWALLIEGSISFPCQRGWLASCVRLPVSWSVTPLSADCDGSAHREQNIWLWVWDWQNRKACSHQPSILPSLDLSTDFIPSLSSHPGSYPPPWPPV